MKMQFKINLSFNDEFEKKVFTDKQEIFGPEFRKQLLGYIGHLLKVTKEDAAEVESFIIKRLDPTTGPDEDIKNDISGAAQ
jgi:hypothetical protein